jgi:RNA polymerase sigma factor (sigma-70 family)
VESLSFDWVTDHSKRIVNMKDPSWPDFLNWLDNDPERASTEFYKFLVWTLNKVPPRPMRGLNQEAKEDLIHDIYLHCINHNFRVLRQYKNTGKPFAAWLYVVAHNYCIDHLRAEEQTPDTVSIDQTRDYGELIEILPDQGPNPNQRIEWADLLAIVRKLMSKLDEYCQLLLQMAADEDTIKEMLTTLRLTPDQNKKISDDLRYCRKKLKKKLAENGIDHFLD